MRISIQSRAVGEAARDQVYAALREAIVSAELAPGRKLSENELAERLGVSRTPVREALVRLRDERLVAIVPQLGTFVTLISDDGVADAAFVREALECAAARLAAARADDAGLADLRANLLAQERARDDGDTETFERLHEVIPAEWLDCAATGSAQRCAELVRHQFDLGVDGVILHGATPAELATTVAAFAEQEQSARAGVS